jgi:hypothetical protein
MDRTDQVFVVVVVLSVSLGTVAAVTYGDTLAAKERTFSLSGAIEIEISQAEIVDDRLSFTVRMRNPTSADVTATGVYVNVFDRDGDRLAYGSASAFEQTSVPSGETRVVQVSVPLTTAQEESLRRALTDGNGFVISGQYGMIYEDVEFRVQSATNVSEVR